MEACWWCTNNVWTAIKTVPVHGFKWIWG
uniref:NADH dehydrogenase n=1 Tax=Arundo donax TaxID=35708 RepID=A0A0A9F3K6_ARUDO